MATGDRAPEVDLFADTGPIDWDGVPSDHSSQGNGLESGEIEQSSEERQRQAALAEDMRREAEQKEREEKRRYEEEEKGRKSKKPELNESTPQQGNYMGSSNQQQADNENQWWKKKSKKKKKKNAETITCELCDVKCTGRAAYDNHLQGQKHRKKERQAILNGSVNRDLNSHYRNAAVMHERRPGPGPSHAGEYVDLDQPRTHPPPAHIQTPVSSLPSHNRHYIAPPSYHPHQEHVKPRNSPVTADPRPHSPPPASPLPSPLPSRLGSRDTGPVETPTSPRLTNRARPDTPHPSRPEAEHGPHAVRSRQAAAQVSAADGNDPNGPSKLGSSVPVDDVTVRKTAGMDMDQSRNPKHVSHSSAIATSSAGPKEQLTSRKVEKPLDTPFVQQKVSSADFGKETHAESGMGAGKLVHASATEGPREQDLSKSQGIAKKAWTKAFTSVVTPRPFVKTSSRRKPSDSKPLTDGDGGGIPDNSKAPSNIGLNMSHDANPAGPIAASDPIIRISNLQKGKRNSDANIGTKNMASDTPQDLAARKVGGARPLGEAEPSNIAPASDKPPVALGGKTTGGIVETKGGSVDPYKQPNNSDVIRPSRGGNSPEGSSAANRNAFTHVVREEPRPSRPQPVSPGEGAHTRPKSAPVAPGNERKRKRCPDDQDPDRIEGRSADRLNVTERRLSNGDRRYEDSGSQRRRLEDLNERESLRRDGLTDYDHKDHRGRDDRRENRWPVEDVREDRRARDREPRGREDSRDERRIADNSRNTSRARNDNRDDRWRRDELREEPRAKENRREDRATREDYRDSRRRRDDRRVDGRGRDDSREDRWRRDDPRDDRRAQEDQFEIGKAREDWRDDRRGRNDPRDDRRTRDDYRKDRRTREDHRERRDRDSIRDVKKAREDKREDLQKDKNPYVNETSGALIPTPPTRHILAKDLERYHLVPKEWQEKAMTVAEWRELRHYALMKGTDADKLAYKMMQEILLSPVVGMDFHNLAPLSRALLHSVKDFYFTGDRVLARYSDYPSALINGDPRYESNAKKDENWAREQAPEYLALCNLHDNIMFSFEPNVDPVMNARGVLECTDLPPRGSYGAKNQRKGPGASNEGMRAPRYPDAVSEDPLFQKISAYLRARKNNTTRGNSGYLQR
eukprot:GFKZ01007439.1.p1 GENE.GFKZ01007439.1~~GFKZ01007439.1.p1  ORF type:complete len:1139 (+),score=166.44 GFKZ01007439.1:165-3581(+)